MREIKTYCDICNKVGVMTYPSWFEIKNGVVSSKGCLRYQLTVDLCPDHFKVLETALQREITEQIASQSTTAETLNP